MKKFERGSLWRKWDLHIHTPKSVFNNGFLKSGTEEENFDKYIYELFTRAIDNQICAIGLTDYFTIEGYKLVNEYLNDKEKMQKLFATKISADDKYLEKIYDIQIFPNIEFRLGEIVVNAKGNQSKIEAHVIFDNNLTVDEINDNFLSKLDFITSTSIEGSTNYSLNRRNLEKLGEIIKEQQPEFNSKSNFEVGCEMAYVNFDQLKEILDKNFKNKYILLFAEDDITDINWHDQGHMIRKNIYSKSDGIFSSNPRTIKWGLEESTKMEFSSYKPCFWGSDAHNYDKMYKPDMDRFCWIKSDLTFKGLRQVLINPIDRIYIGPIVPDYDNYLKNKQNIISQIEIHKNDNAKNSDIWFDETIKINPYMTTIIGNKGSGKSALSDIIAMVSNNKNIKYASFINDDRFKKKPENYANDYNASIIWADGNINSVDNLSNEVDDSSVELVQFLPQRYIENVCSGIKHEFSDEIERTIFSYMDLAEKEGCTSLSQLISKKTLANYEEYQLLKNELESTNIEIIKLETKKTTLHKKTIEEKISSLNLTLTRHDETKPTEVIKPIEEDNKYANLLVYIDDTQVKLKEEYNKKLEYLKNINEKITSINNFKAKKNIVTEKISELNEEYKNIANNLNLKVNSIVNYKINDEELNKKFDELVKTKTELDNFVSKTEVELNLLTIPVEFEYTIENLNLLIEKLC